MKFSIIIPVYNAEEKLSRCIDSIVSQPFSDYEIVLVNDGSTDNSAEICNDYCKKYSFIKYIEKDNGGASSARNVGIDNATGDYLLFVDSDDYVDTCYFEELNNNCIESGLSVFTYTWLRKNSRDKREIKEITGSNFDKIYYLMASRTINSPCSKVFDRHLIKSLNLKFEENMPVAEDFNFCLRYAVNCNDISILNESIYFYDTTNEKSLVHKRKVNMIDVYPFVFDYAFSTIENSSFSLKEKNCLFKIWDKLHTDSFVTCVIEELKDESLSAGELLNRIKEMCSKFYSEYKPIYGYVNAVHFFVRFCIKYRLSFVLLMACRFYSRLRGK